MDGSHIHLDSHYTNHISYLKVIRKSSHIEICINFNNTPPSTEMVKIRKTLTHPLDLWGMAHPFDPLDGKMQKNNTAYIIKRWIFRTWAEETRGHSIMI